MNEIRDSPQVSAPPPARVAADRSVPRVRTLLVCDLADSTALVERLGDGAAADLLRRHDRIARDLLQKHGGREIDKTDGFLALFERPVEAVAFALDYQRALRGLGDEARQPLRARVGIHVGEVVLWENSASDVSGGAKPVDVEGLAKPVAARLMALALPGQTLLSGIAFSLAQRAGGELAGARDVRWLTHGRYRFKGVPAPMLVHEVGESGFSPLHAPPSSGKAERDIPLWRKPGVLTLEAILLATAIAVPFALSLRAPPAIAFGERDWVVVGDLRNLTSEPALQESLETAFRISLEQSRYVNVLPDLKLRDTLARMQRPPDTDVDRAVASEIAMREGARAVILPTVAEVGGRVRVSAEVIDPHTQTTVYAESADGVGAESALESVDTVTHELRARLGEALSAIDTDSSPLPRVTSGNIDALRAYSLAAQAQAQSRRDDARALYERALEIDPQFALAHLGLARLRAGAGDRAGAMRHARQAHAFRERLTARDALYADAWLATFGPPAASMSKWKLLAEVYPDYFAGPFNYALYVSQYANRYAEATEYALRAVSPQNPLLGGVHYTLGALYAAQDRFDDARRHFEAARNLGETAAGEYRAGFALAQGQGEEARTILTAAAANANAAERASQERWLALIDVDAGRLAEARRLLDETSRSQALAATGRDVMAVGALSLDAIASDEAFATNARRFVEAQRGAVADAGNIERDHAVYTTLLAGYLAARAGVDAVADAAAAQALAAAQGSGYPNVESMARIFRVEQLRRAGDPSAAYELLQPMLDGNELYQARSAALRALRDAGRDAEALTQADWLLAHRGLAFLEWGNNQSQGVLNAVDARLAMLDRAELLQRLQRPGDARAALDAFDRAWPQAPAAAAQRSRALRERLR